MQERERESKRKDTEHVLLSLSVAEESIFP